MIAGMPPPDRLVSSRTGWTRHHWIALADHLLASLRPYDSPHGARFDLPGRASWSGRDCDGLEGFARSMLTAAARIAATAGQGCQDVIDRYSAGLAAGADPASPEAWPRLTPCSQQMVEASIIAIALNESRPWLWDRLDSTTQGHVVDWLSGFVGSRTWDNNWILFQVTGEEFLASVGADHRRDDIDRGLERIEQWYRSDGWYTDGDGQNFDYYNAFVMHPYPVLWARMAERSGINTTERMSAYRSRLRAHLEQLQHFVGSDGAPILYGRSTTYRAAMLAPFWIGALVDATPLAPGQTRRLCSGVMRQFVEHGVPDEAGLLSLGWQHRFLPMTQPYSGPGSPYWASKAFLGLLMPADHPVWTAPEVGLDIDRHDSVVSMPAPGFLIHTTRHDGIVRLVNHGSDHLSPPVEGSIGSTASPSVDPQYDRLGYSSRTGPELPSDLASPAIDSGVHLITADGTTSRRGRIHRLGHGPDHAASWSPAVWESVPGQDIGSPEQIPIEVTSIVHGPYELRCIRVIPVGKEHGCRALMGGHAVASTTIPPTGITGTDAQGRPWATVTRPDGLTAAVWGLAGCDRASIRHGADSNPYGPMSLTPVVDATITDRPIVMLVSLTQETVWPEATAAAIELEVLPDRVRVRLPGSPITHEVTWGLDGPEVRHHPEFRQHKENAP